GWGAPPHPPPLSYSTSQPHLRPVCLYVCFSFLKREQTYKQRDRLAVRKELLLKEFLFSGERLWGER
ncbi:hypothetical protein OVZ95_02415, partial [Pseudomonas aeruginosa]|uniref:hypothetical protein n=1 Tax=Pseudomonas aeruginosa TaxID=287 RepID=UPI002271D77F